jgi:2-polyprenyl-3-methyl-5-hydroxy-6-metoxy-1,4-benzoquinol methylase
VTIASLADMRSRLYEAYASQHAGTGDSDAAALIYRRDIRPLLPSPAADPIVDIGCGSGALIRLLHADGFDAEGIDISPEWNPSMAQGSWGALVSESGASPLGARNAANAS